MVFIAACAPVATDAVSFALTKQAGMGYLKLPSMHSRRLTLLCSHPQSAVIQPLWQPRVSQARKSALPLQYGLLTPV